MFADQNQSIKSIEFVKEGVPYNLEIYNMYNIRYCIYFPYMKRVILRCGALLPIAYIRVYAWFGVSDCYKKYMLETT